MLDNDLEIGTFTSTNDATKTSAIRRKISTLAMPHLIDNTINSKLVVLTEAIRTYWIHRLDSMDSQEMKEFLSRFNHDQDLAEELKRL